MNQPKDLGATATGLSTPPHNISEAQAKDIIAYYWIVNPNIMYEGLKIAFNLAPKSTESIQ